MPSALQTRWPEQSLHWSSLLLAPAGRAGVVVIGRMMGAGMTMWAEQALTMAGEDVAGLTLALQPAATVSGSVKFSGSLAPPEGGQIRLNLTPVDQAMNSYTNIQPAMVNANGTFRFTLVPPGRYRLSVPIVAGRGAFPGVNSALKGWLPRSAQVGDADALDVPFEVELGAPPSDIVLTFTDRLAQISGRVSTASGQPLSNYRDYHIVVFSADRALWGAAGRRLKTPVALDPDGTYRVEELPAGDYFLAAVTEIDERDLTDVAFLTDLSKAALPVTVHDGEQKVQNFAIPGRF